MENENDYWIGAQPDTSGTEFKVWATKPRTVDVVIFQEDSKCVAAIHPLKRDNDGYFSKHILGIKPGSRYKYRLDGRDFFPDPASRYQPEGVHGPSQVVETALFNWTDDEWHGVKSDDLVIYEVHVGTATLAGTFDSLIDRLDYIRKLGATAIELMPVADFPGERNWGYDGVCLFAPAKAYGGHKGLQRLVNEAHARNLAVILDVVYNHLGPEGNYLPKFSKGYFNDSYETPWGSALNFGCPAVRQFFIANARYWAHEYHIDGLRIDAIQAMHDDAELHILAELTLLVRDHSHLSRSFLIIAEDNRNDRKLVLNRENRGYGLDAVWADDFHHQIRVALTDEINGYYIDYDGTNAEHLARTLNQGWFYSGQYSEHFRGPRGTLIKNIHPRCFIHHIENHDQVGNRPHGERLAQMVNNLSAYRAASTLLLLSPYTPLLFMGQEWAASTPFLYFTDHSEQTGLLVTKGHQEKLEKNFPDFSSNEWHKPQDLETFQRSKLQWEERNCQPHAAVLCLYHDLLKLRRELLDRCSRERWAFRFQHISTYALALRWMGGAENDDFLLIVNLRGRLKFNVHEEGITAPPSSYIWNKQFGTEDSKYDGREDTQLIKGEKLEMTGPGGLLLALTPKPKLVTTYFDIFLCHNNEDKPEIRKIDDAFRKAGISAWFDERQLNPGDAWQKKLEAQIGNIKMACVFVGRNGIAPWQNAEMEALLNEFHTRGCHIFPVILPDATEKPELPLFLKQIHWADLRGEAYTGNLNKLIATIYHNK